MKHIRFLWSLLSLCLLITCSACSTSATNELPLASSTASSLSETRQSNAPSSALQTEHSNPVGTSLLTPESSNQTDEASISSAATDLPTTSTDTTVETTLSAVTFPSATATFPVVSETSELTTAEPVSHAAYFSIVGKDGDLLVARTAVSTDDCQSVYDGLRKFCNEQNIPMESSGSGAFIYVRSLCGLKEFDGGPLSGWVYVVNGVYASVGTGGMALCPGDEVVFYYTLDLGKDVQSRLVS